MSLPSRITINEEGPREGFQIEPGPIPTADKIALVDALSETGLTHIQVCSFVNPKKVPGMADADAIACGIKRKPGVQYTGLWLNEKGLDRAIANGCLDIIGKMSLTVSVEFLRQNQNVTHEENLALMRRLRDAYIDRNIPIDRVMVMSAFGCNFQGDVSPDDVLARVADLVEMAAERDMAIPMLSLADTMGWATPERIKRMLGAVRDRYPDLPLNLHLHDTRGLGIANAYAGLEMGVANFDTSVAGLGGCPFAGHKGAAGNVCTEDLVFMCEEMGIETGVDLDKLLDAALLAERIVGHPLPGMVKRGGSLSAKRKEIAA
ncbi:hydroxymethylglutaryl-CoA lyase [Oceanicola sp. 22II-s10i]|uniref:hydroxymethylglutaryl-CoA lyase n=1 Tax=Oceanicola sp. 22II-s10i TaxID=1317116 RepID=UPI000B523D37|nr:hydroxymethylglutaryl-CoA lyase [Oceanicola sp. 22II-s10i]OWU86406.1 hydroxymethylglutaryl-CoA lyase [Oceanicola sp. 22II-s10i]